MRGGRLLPSRVKSCSARSFTDGALFDSVGLRRVQLSTDDRMYPESQRGYAPIVRGIAGSNARVQCRQGGNIIAGKPPCRRVRSKSAICMPLVMVVILS